MTDIFNLSTLGRRRRKRKVEDEATLQDYNVPSDVVFLRNLDQNHDVNQLPPMRDVLAYIAKLPEQPLWYKASQDAIINTQSMKFPDIPVLTRDYISHFMQKALKNEPECSHRHCESERLGGFRIRALIVPGQEMNDWCYLCHLSYTNRLYFESLNRKQEPKNSFVQIHHFMVQVDVPGEYRLDMTLMGEKDVKGIFGPFPLYNCNHYAATDKGWKESDVMVFRLSQTAPSDPIECNSVKGKESGFRPFFPIGCQ